MALRLFLKVAPFRQRCEAFLDRSVLAYKHAAQASGFRDTHSLALRACIAGSKCVTALPSGARTRIVPNPWGLRPRLYAVATPWLKMCSFKTYASHLLETRPLYDNIVKACSPSKFSGATGSASVDPDGHRQSQWHTFGCGRRSR